MRHSCGFILVRFRSHSDVEFLLQCRRDSIPYLMYLQGRHDGTLEGVRALWSGMTHEEHARLRSGAFRRLFQSARIHPDLWEQGQRMYQRTVRFLQELDDKDGWETPEWGFPKGRKSHARESERDCALRELLEETGLREEQIRILEVAPIRERFQGTDKKTYVCDYYVAEAMADPTLRPRPADDPEVSALCWLQADEVCARFRPWEPYRRETLTRVQDILRERFSAKNEEDIKSNP